MDEDIPPDVAARVGTTLAGRYRLVRVLGVGGMGAVYEADQTMLRRRVAVKLMLSAAPTAAALGRFLREAQLAARLQHPNVVTVYDSGQDPADGSLYLVQEYLAGETLRALLEREGRLPAPRAVGVLLPILEAVIAAHAAGIVHRDIKPENVFLVGPVGGAAPVPKLLDFGIARSTAPGGNGLTHTGTFMGSLLYTAPEQLQDAKRATAQADLWAVGVILFELVAGQHPWPATSMTEAVRWLLFKPVPRLEAAAPNAPPWLVDVVHRALGRDLTKRVQSATAMHGALVAGYEGRVAPLAPFAGAPAGSTAFYSLEEILKLER